MLNCAINFDVHHFWHGSQMYLLYDMYRKLFNRWVVLRYFCSRLLLLIVPFCIIRMACNAVVMMTMIWLLLVYFSPCHTQCHNANRNFQTEIKRALHTFMYSTCMLRANEKLHTLNWRISRSRVCVCWSQNAIRSFAIETNVKR